MKNSDFPAQALNGNVIIAELPNENKTETGIDLSLAVDQNEKYIRGRVVSFGEYCPKMDKKMSFLEKLIFLLWGYSAKGDYYINLGDEVLFDKYKSSDVTICGNSYKVANYSDLMLIF